MDTVDRVTSTRVRRSVSAGPAFLALLGLVSSLALLGPATTATASAGSAPAVQQEPGARYITLEVNKKEVRKGKTIKLRGAVVAATDASCAAGQVLDVQRSTHGASFPVVGSVTTDAAGAFTFSIVVKKKARFRVSVAASATCVAAVSPPRSVDIKPTS